jgi:hypothetical protein
MSKMRFSMRILGFAAVPALSAISPLVALPAVTSVGGAQVWAAIAIGQSLGLAGATIVELGWGLNGPQRLARASASNRRRALAMSLQTRVLVFPIVALACGSLAWLLAPSHNWLAVAMAIASTATGLSLVWYFIGRGSPARLLATDSVPRLILVTLSAIAVLSGAPLIVYPLLGVLAPALIAPSVGSLVEKIRWRHFRGIGIARTTVLIRSQFVAMSGRFVSALYIALPITLVGAVAPQAVPVFAAAERLQRMYLSVLAAIPNALQGWVGRPATMSDRLRRAETSTYFNAGVGLVSGTVFALGAPLASDLVFSGVAHVPLELSVLCGVVIVLVSCSRAVGGLILVAVNRVRVVLQSAVVGAVVGVPAILILSHRYGAIGGISGEIVAEISVLTFQSRAWLMTKFRR